MNNNNQTPAPRVHANPLPQGKVPLAQAIQAYNVPGQTQANIGAAMQNFQNRVLGK